MNKVTWLNRTLFQGPHLALVTSQKQFDAALKHLKLKDDSSYCNPTADATTHSYINADGNLCCVVGLRSKSQKNPPKMDVYCLLVHEAVHVWQQVRSQITLETDPSRTGGLEAEMEAYAVQNIAQTLMEAYENQRKKA
ncbi:MAG: hypothetical protein PHD99_04765 [Candidatus Moranbacteria bacterium]|nr:hypothetical protein [Candidatus Moranbacteria bacterium]